MAKNLKPSKLYVVGLPIGNPLDLTERARLTLQVSDKIFCEDTRKTRELLERSQVAIKAKLVALPGQREKEILWDQEFKKSDGEIWALVSDAGTPLVNDPGLHLLKACQLEGINVSAIPGACAPILAWQWSGGFGLPFYFAGFAPKAKSYDNKSLQDFFSPATRLGGTFCFFDTKHQIETTLEHLVKSPQFSHKRLCIAREATKEHEELICGLPSDCLKRIVHLLKEQKGALGELTLLLQGTLVEATGKTDISLAVLKQLRESSPRHAARIMSELSGLSVNDCYKALQEK